MSPRGEAALEGAESVARRAGAFQLAEFRTRPAGWGDEKAAHDFVSHVDLESEAIIKEGLAAVLPEAAFYGEEGGGDAGAELLWVVDPLDGTTNYLSGIDAFCVSIALVEKNVPSLACVHKPHGDETFTAARGLGAFRDGKRLPKVKDIPLARSLLATGTPYRSPDTRAAFLETLDAVLPACRDLRRPGSAALDLCYLASGWFQGFWEVDLGPHDVAAALLMLAETGCPFSEFSGAPYRLFKSRSLVAGHPCAYGELSAIVRERYGGLRA